MFSARNAPDFPLGNQPDKCMHARAYLIVIAVLCQLFLIHPCMGAEQEKAAWSDTACEWLKNHARFSGWFETTQGVRLYATEEVISSRIQARLEASLDWHDFSGFVSLDAEKNWIVEDNSRVAFREAWLEYNSSPWTFRIGRQIIVWGKADGLRITDNVSPVDYSDFMNRQRDELRIPVGAALLRHSGEYLSTEIVWIPEFRPSRYPDRNDPWGMLFAVGDDPAMYETDANMPDSSFFADSELGLRVSGFFPALDVSASVLYTWDDNPAYYGVLEWHDGAPRIKVQPDHKRVTILGLDFSVPWGEFVFRAEGALFLGKHVTSTTIGVSPQPKTVGKWVLGVDWTPGDDWTVTAQISDEQIFLYQQGLGQNEHRHIATLNLSKKFFDQTLTVSNMSYFWLDDDALANRFQVEYSIMDGLAVTAGVDILEAAGTYSELKKNSQIWMKLKYSF